MLVATMIRRTDERTRQVAAAAGIVLGLGALVCVVLLGWRNVPGVLGEWLGMVIGVMTTPFFLEASFALLGLSLVILINHWRQKKAGDELVYLEQVDQAVGLPEHAAWAVFREAPLEGGLPTLLEQAEGAMAIGDHAAAADFIAAMTEDELKLPETLGIRLELARSAGLHELAGRLETMLHKTGGGPA
jgi:hypothetical protein